MDTITMLRMDVCHFPTIMDHLLMYTPILGSVFSTEAIGAVAGQAMATAAGQVTATVAAIQVAVAIQVAAAIRVAAVAGMEDIDLRLI
jgi:hypothetical protein